MLKPENPTQKDKIFSLIDHRKCQLLQIQETVSNDEIFFLKMVKISDSIQFILKEKENITIQMRNFFLLGSFISGILEISNSFEKLELLEQLMEEYDSFVILNIPLNAKFLIKEYPKLSIYPAKTQLNARSILKAHKKKKLILTEFIKASKTVVLPQNLNICTIIESICNIIDLVYTIFADKILNYKECFETIMKIDSFLQSRFFNVVLDDLLKVTTNVLSEELIKVTDILFNTENDVAPDSKGIILKLENFFD